MKAQKLTALVLTVLLSAACGAKSQKKTENASSTANSGKQPEPAPTPTPSLRTLQLQKLNQSLTQQLIETQDAKPGKPNVSAMNILEALEVANEESGHFTNLTPNANSQWLELQKGLFESKCAKLNASLKEAFQQPHSQLVIVSAMSPEFWTKFCQLSHSWEVRQRYSLRLRADGAVDLNFSTVEGFKSKKSITFDLLAPLYVNLHAFKKIEATFASEQVQTNLTVMGHRFQHLLPAAQGLNEWYAWASALDSIRSDILTPLKAMRELPAETDRKLAKVLLSGVSTWLSQIEPILKEAEEAQSGQARLLVNAVRMDQDTFEEKSPSSLYLEATQALEMLRSQLYAGEILRLELALGAIPKAAAERYKQAAKAFAEPIKHLNDLSLGANALANKPVQERR